MFQTLPDTLLSIPVYAPVSQVEPVIEIAPEYVVTCVFLMSPQKFFVLSKLMLAPLLASVAGLAMSPTVTEYVYVPALNEVMPAYVTVVVESAFGRTSFASFAVGLVFVSLM